MSKLHTPQGDDHPEAAGKHLADAEVLLAAKRADGAAYLSGYVVECSLKSLWLHQTGIPTGRKMPWGRDGHNLDYLCREVAQLAAFADTKVARYVGPVTAAISVTSMAIWTSEMRYRSPAISLAQAQAWAAIAGQVFQETVAEMWLDGVL
ncbi:MAG: hypothetical protein AB3X44_18265 [Leptothrix sp. (in: b-proteobacteria)]